MSKGSVRVLCALAAQAAILLALTLPAHSGPSIDLPVANTPQGALSNAAATEPAAIQPAPVDAEAAQEKPISASEVLLELERGMANIATLSADFRQEKSLAAFRNKIVMNGKVFIRKPRILAWHVTSPIRYSVVVTDKVIRQWDEDTRKVNEFAYTKNPMMKGVLDQMTAWFDGNYSGLMKSYTVSIAKRSPLVLEFRPAEGSMAAKAVEYVRVAFKPDRKHLDWLFIMERGGDRTLIEFSNTVVDAPLSDKVFEVDTGAL